MRTTQIGNMTVIGMTEDQEIFMKKREAFVQRYLKEHNVDVKTMSIQQVLEMRKEEGWKNPQ